MSDATPTEKRCTKCGEIKLLDAFVKDQSRKDGRHSTCKTCRYAYQHAYYAANADAIREQQAVYRVTNAEAHRERSRVYNASNADAIRERKRAHYDPEAKREYNRGYYSANAEAARQYSRAYYAANTDVRRAYNAAYRATNAQTIRDCSRAWKAANADKIRARNRAWKAANPDLNLINVHRRLARKKANGGDGFTASQLKHMRLTQGGFCAYCQEHHLRLSIDHIIPIAQGGRHEAANICLACSKCNLSKGNRTPDQWVNRWYWDWRLREPEYIPPHWYDKKS